MNSATNWHVIVAGVIVTIVSVTMLAMKIPIEAVGIVDSLILGVLAHSGLISAADESTVQKLSDSVAPKIATAVQTVEDKLTDMHTVSTANVAAAHTAVAVLAAKIGASPPPPLVAPVAVIKEASPVVVEASHEL